MTNCSGIHKYDRNDILGSSEPDGPFTGAEVSGSGLRPALLSLVAFTRRAWFYKLCMDRSCHAARTGCVRATESRPEMPVPSLLESYK